MQGGPQKTLTVPGHDGGDKARRCALEKEKLMILMNRGRAVFLPAATILAFSSFAAADELDRFYLRSGSCGREAVAALRVCRISSGIEGGCEEQFEARLELCSAFGEPKPKAEKTVELKDARLKIEVNATDRDAGIQVFIDADPWKSMEIFDPNGKRVFRSVTRGRFGKQGGTELFLESAEPNFSELTLEAFLERFPEGEYVFEGVGMDDESLVGTARLTHNLPDGPVLAAPAKDALVDRQGTVTLQWRPVAPPNGSPIIGYQVIVVKPETGIKALPKITLDVMMPPEATSMTIPAGFLLANSEYEWEVLAIERGGNQTLSVSAFRTRP